MTAHPENIGGLKTLLHRDIQEPINVNVAQEPIVSKRHKDSSERRSTNGFKDLRFELERKVDCTSVHCHRDW